MALIVGTSGSDTLSGTVDDDIIFGLEDADTLIGDDGNDKLDGGSGPDSLSGGAGLDTLIGGPGADVTVLSANDTFSYETATSRIVLNSSAGVYNSLSRAGDAVGDSISGRGIILGSPFNDIINYFATQVFGGDGDDIIHADVGASSAITINGGEGNDILFPSGPTGARYANGDAGNDFLSGISHGGTTFLDGGAEFDVVTYNHTAIGQPIAGETNPVGLRVDLLDNANNLSAAQNDVFISIEGVIGSSNSDSIYGDNSENYLDGIAGADILFGRDGADTLLGGQGNDTLDGGIGNDSLDGGQGVDTLSYASSAGVDLVLADGGAGRFSVVGFGMDDYAQIEGIDGSLTGSDMLIGNASDNLLRTFGGADVLAGGFGNDTLEAGDGNDFLTGGAGDDALNGGLDFDFANYLDATSGVTVSLVTSSAQAVGGGQGTDTLTSIEGIFGSNLGDTLTGNNLAVNAIYAWGGADSIIGNGGFDYVEAGAGDDTLDGGAGDDFLVGDIGTDTVTFAGAGAAVYVDMSGASAFANGTATGFDVLSSIERVIGSGLGDFLFGSAGADTLAGGNGIDIIYGFGQGDSLDGGADTDYIVGGTGADTITTGAGQDFIYFQGQNEGKDTITDWRINGFDLLVMDEPSFGAGLISGQYLSSESWRFVTGTAATANFGQFIWNSANSTLSWDADGTGAGSAVQLVTLTGVTSLTAGDILVL